MTLRILVILKKYPSQILELSKQNLLQHKQKRQRKKLEREEKKQSSIEREQAFAVNANAYIEHLKTGASAGLRDEAWRKKA
jgi:hypothetical protein